MKFVTRAIPLKAEGILLYPLGCVPWLVPVVKGLLKNIVLQHRFVKALFKIINFGSKYIEKEIAG